jgi:ATP-binding cassette, subfamily C, bacterial exporter for protease/lipase
MTHRTSIFPVVDKILVLRDGQVQAFAPRDEVLGALAKAAAQAQQQRAVAVAQPRAAHPA